jgi:pimeloyl-ACP methyl ester carboxylesterase
MRTLHDFANEGQRAPALAILLPGALQQPEEFMRAGFVDAVRRRRLALDLALVDPGLQFIGEATDGTALQRLHESVVQPARAKGYDAIWIAGISLGGFMALKYVDSYPGNVAGLCLLAPYPGNRIVTNEITAAGGLARWQAENAGDDAEYRMWRWLRQRAPDRSGPQLYLGYGLEDRFAAGQRMMAQALVADDVDTIDGGHDWPVWLRLWENFLERRTFPVRQS